MNKDIARSIRRAGALLLTVSIFLIAGCSDDSTVAPSADNQEIEPPPVEIKTPKKMRITHIFIVWGPLTKSNGDTWDFDLINADNRRPDIYFKLGDYTTGVINNYDASSQVGPQQLDFSYPNFGQMNYDGSYTLQLYDKDTAIQGADDLMGSFSFRPDTYYQNDNAEGFNIPMESDGKFKAYAIGIWIY
jgi:hypothetical protein